MLAPICFFTYNRFDETRQAIEALRTNYLASDSNIFIFSDGPKNELDSCEVMRVREYLKTISGFKSVEIYESVINKGLANSIIDGVSEVVNRYGNVIVIEDDLVTTPNFLDFMNQALIYYQKNPKIYSVSGYSMSLPALKDYPHDYYFGYRASSWGWGTWKEKWKDVDWQVSQYKSFKINPIMQIKFMRGGSDMPNMLKKQIKGEIDSWAIRWCFDQFIKDQFTVFPKISKINSIGFGKNATHTKNPKRFDTEVDDGVQRIFNFNHKVEINKKIAKDFRKKFSFCSRLMDNMNIN